MDKKNSKFVYNPSEINLFPMKILLDHPKFSLGSVADFTIQPSGMVEFEDGLRIGNQS